MHSGFAGPALKRLGLERHHLGDVLAGALPIEDALVEVAGVAPEHFWVKFEDSKKTDFIIPEARPE